MTTPAARTPSAPDPVSVIVPFLGSEAHGRRATDALAILDVRPEDELFIVDNTADGVVSEADTGPVTVLRAPDQRSAYHARNEGARRANGKWLLFLDADCAAPRDLLDAYLEPAPAASVAIVAGELVGDESQEAIAARWSRSRRGLRTAQHLEVGPSPAGVTGNMLVRRAVFEQAGGFIPGIRSDADVELCWRIQDAGYGFEYRPQALVVHRDPERVRDLVRQAAGYGAGRRWTNRHRPGSGHRPPLARPIARALAGGAVFGLSGRFERAAFKLIDGVWDASFWWGYRAGSNRSR